MKVSHLKRIEHLFAFTQQLDQAPVKLCSKYQQLRSYEKVPEGTNFSELRANGKGFAGLGEAINEDWIGSPKPYRLNFAWSLAGYQKVFLKRPLDFSLEIL